MPKSRSTGSMEPTSQEVPGSNAPQIGAAAQGFGGGPVAKIRSSGRMRLGLRSRGRVDNSDRERLLSQNGDRPLDDLASARLSTVAGILLPSIDHALRLGFRGCRARLASALAFRGRRLRRAFRSLPCHLVSPIPESPTSNERRPWLALLTAFPSWCIQWRYDVR